MVNREQGATANIAKDNVKVHCLFTLSYLLEVLRDAGKINQTMVDAVSKFIAESQTVKETSPKIGISLFNLRLNTFHLNLLLIHSSGTYHAHICCPQQTSNQSRCQEAA